jgi:glycosyltransferase involved in cell wall biosynthesis
MRELIKNGETGLLFKSRNADSLADILLNVLNNKEICKKLQKNALIFAEQNKKLFDTREVSKAYQDLLISE